MIGSDFQAGFAGFAHIVDKAFVLESAPFGGFYEYKLYALGFHSVKVDVTVMRAHVDAHDFIIAEARHSVRCPSVLATSGHHGGENQYERNVT